MTSTGSAGDGTAPSPDGPGGPGEGPRELLARCRAEPTLIDGILEVYREVDAALAELDVRCLGGGACCKFDLFDHRLYLSVGELAVLAEGRPPGPGRALRRRCPYQMGPVCAAHPRRPLGCRTFFCRPGGGDAPADLHERAHRRIATLHERCSVPYLYGEFCGMLAQLSGG